MKKKTSKDVLSEAGQAYVLLLDSIFDNMDDIPTNINMELVLNGLTYSINVDIDVDSDLDFDDLDEEE